jgi:hypothetical protein
LKFEVRGLKLGKTGPSKSLQRGILEKTGHTASSPTAFLTFGYFRRRRVSKRSPRFAKSLIIIGPAENDG